MQQQQSTNKKLTYDCYNQLQQDSPQIHPQHYPQHYQIKQFQLQTSDSLRLNSPRKRKFKPISIKQKQTQLIQIKPVSKKQQEQQEQVDNVNQSNKEDRSLKQTNDYLQQQYCQVQRQQQKNNYQNRPKPTAIHQIQSPILYKFSDDDNQQSLTYQQNRQFPIPQSSRRRFKSQQQDQHQQTDNNQKQRNDTKLSRNRRKINRSSSTLNKINIQCDPSNNDQRTKKKSSIYYQQQQQVTNKQNYINNASTFQRIYQYEGGQMQQQQDQQQQYQQQQQVNQDQLQQQQVNQDELQQQQVNQDQQQQYQYQNHLQYPQQQQKSQQQQQTKTKHPKININDKIKTKSISNNHVKKQPQSITILKSASFYTLINAPIPKNNYINCIIKRIHINNNRSKSTLLPFQTQVIYQMYLLQDKKLLMTCVKDRLFNFNSHFMFYKQKISSSTHQHHQQNLYAILDSNFTGTQYVLKTILKNDTISQRSTAIDKSDIIKIDQSATTIGQSLRSSSTSKVGILFKNQQEHYSNHNNNNDNHRHNNSDQLTNNNNSLQSSQQIKQSCFISFKANFFGLGGQRQVKILKKKNKKIQKTQRFSDIKDAYQRNQLDKITQLHNKKARKGKNGLQLDLRHNANMQSTKNMIIEDKQQKEVIIFGKIKEDIYSISIGSPLSIIDGLAFGIANLDRKFFVN